MTKSHTEGTDSSLWPLTVLPEVLAAAEAVGKKKTPDEPCPPSLEELWRKYQGPLRVHLRGKFRSFPAIMRNSEDLLQDFAVKKLLKKDWLGRSVKYCDNGKRRFRDFLRMGLNNVVWDWWRDQPQYKSWEASRKDLWKEKAYFSAIDPTGSKYAVVVLDRSGAVSADFQFLDSSDGWTEFDAKVFASKCPMAVELSSLASIREPLSKRRFPLYAIEGKEAKRHRRQKAPPEVTTEGRGAWSLANALRTKGYAWSPFTPQPGDEIPCLGEFAVIELPSDLDTPPDDSDPFDFECSKAVLTTTLERMEQSCKDPSREQPHCGNIWEIFRLRILDPMLKGTKPVRYKELIEQLKLRSPNEASSMLWTAKNIFKRTLDVVVSEDPGSGPAKSELQRLVAFVDKLAENQAEKKAKKKRDQSNL